MTKFTQIPSPIYPLDEPEPCTASEDYGQPRAREAAAALVDAFGWSMTVEGHDFWDGVYRRLLAIADGEALR